MIFLKNFLNMNNSKKFFILLLLALILRISWNYYVPTEPFSDFKWYHGRAIEISEGKGYSWGNHPTAYWAIGYPALLALFYWIFGPYIIVGKVLNIILSLGIVYMVFLLANKIYKDVNIAFLAAIITMLSPHQIMYTGILGSETLFCFLLLALNTVYFVIKENKWKYVLLGILLGLVSLVKPYGLAYPIAILMYETLLGKNNFSYKKFGFLILIMILTISPWTIRNFFVMKAFIPISTNGGLVFYLNNNPHATGKYTDPFSYPDSPMTKYQYPDKTWNEVAVDKLGKKLAMQWIIENPKKFIELGFKRLSNTFFKIDDIQWVTYKLSDGKQFGYENQLALVIKLYYYVVLFLFGYFFLLFIFTFLFQDRFIMINLIFFCLIFFVFEGQARYMFPILPLFYLGASIALVRIYKYSKILLKSDS